MQHSQHSRVNQDVGSGSVPTSRFGRATHFVQVTFRGTKVLEQASRSNILATLLTLAATEVLEESSSSLIAESTIPSQHIHTHNARCQNRTDQAFWHLWCLLRHYFCLFLTPPPPHQTKRRWHVSSHACGSVLFNVASPPCSHSLHFFSPNGQRETHVRVNDVRDALGPGPRVSWSGDCVLQ